MTAVSLNTLDPPETGTKALRSCQVLLHHRQGQSCFLQKQFELVTIYEFHVVSTVLLIKAFWGEVGACYEVSARDTVLLFSLYRVSKVSYLRWHNPIE